MSSTNAFAKTDYLTPHWSGSTGIGTDCTFRALEHPNPALPPSLLSQGKFTKLVENSNATFVSFTCMGLLVNFAFGTTHCHYHSLVVVVVIVLSNVSSVAHAYEKCL